MNDFESDLLGQEETLRTGLEQLSKARPALSLVLNQLSADAPRIVVSGMGSSLSASELAVARITVHRPAELIEAGELLHYGANRIEPDSLVILVSQSGKSAETLAFARQLRESGSARIITVTNDVHSPLAGLADFVLPIHAGAEAAVATKTFMNTFVAMQSLADLLTRDSEQYVAEAIYLGLADIVGALTQETVAADEAAERFAGCNSLVVVGRGPALGAAEYGALIIAETAATHAAAMPAASFRHGPLEMSGPGVGLIVLAPAGRTRDLCIRLAHDACAAGSPTWVIGDVESVRTSPQLLPTAVPTLREQYSPLLLSVPIQQFAAALARQKGREPGDLISATKVTEVQ